MVEGRISYTNLAQDTTILDSSFLSCGLCGSVGCTKVRTTVDQSVENVTLQDEEATHFSEPNDKQGRSGYWACKMAEGRPTNNNSNKDHDCGNISCRRWGVAGLCIPFPEGWVPLMVQREYAVDKSSGWGHGRRVKGAARWEGNEKGGCLVLFECTDHCIESASVCMDVREARHSIQA